MNYIVLGLISSEPAAMIGSIYYMASHAFISAGLFFIVGIIYDAYGSRQLMNFSNGTVYHPLLSFFIFIFNFANLSFPMTSSFFSELIILSNLTRINIILVIIAIFFLFFALIYTLWLLHNLIYGRSFTHQNVVVVSRYEIYSLVFLFALVLILGICPNLFLSNLEMQLIYMLQFKYIN